MNARMILSLGALAWLAASCGISGGGAGPQDEPKTGLEIRNVLVTPSDTSAVVRWSTTEQTVGTLAYGRNQTGLSSSVSSTLSAQHSVTLANLDPDTEYWYQITAASPLGPRSATQPVSFRTLVSSDLNDSTPPVISDIQVVGITSSTATVTWNTDDRSNGTVYYGLDPSYGLSLAEADPAAFTRSHALALSGLTEETVVHFRIGATNRSGLHAFSGYQTFTTTALPLLSIAPDTSYADSSGNLTFRVSIANVANLAGLSFMLGYDPQAVEIVGVQEGSFWWDHNGFIPLMTEVQDPQAGRSQYAESWKINFVNTSAVGTDASGGGDVAIITARVHGTDTGSYLRLIDSDENGDGIPETRLLDYNRLPLRFHVRDGWVIKRSR